MKKLLPLIAALGLLCSASLAQAAEGVFNTQHDRIATSVCDQEAGDRKGSERSTFMKQCVRDKKVAQQQKAQACRRDARGKKGAQRRAFIQECMSR